MRLLVFANIAPYQRYPTTEKPVFWDDIDPNVGVWRYPNTTFKHKSSCFDVTYETNSYGARDPERSLQSEVSKRVVVLGDSYVEGYGVTRGSRFTDLLEKTTGIEHLNFGVSGSFGTIQEWLLYKSMASSFDHSDIMLFILPANDFSDNNPADFPPERFRPYLKKTIEGNFEPYYTVDFNDRKVEFRDWGMTIKNGIDNNLYLANFLRFANREIKVTLAGEKVPASPEKAAPHYNNYKKSDLDIMLYSLAQIAELAGTKNLYIFTIPSYEDFTWAWQRQGDLKIVKDLQQFSVQYPNVHYLDLLPSFIDYANQNSLRYSDFTLSCDGHWNALGNMVAAQAIKRLTSLNSNNQL